MNELEDSKESWDFKKIFTFLLVLGLIVFGLKTMVLGQNSSSVPQIQGVVTKDNTRVENLLPREEIQKDVQEKLMELQKEANSINVVEIATSSPAVQKVLNDFKNLQNLPQSQAKQACFKICEGL